MVSVELNLVPSKMSLFQRRKRAIMGGFAAPDAALGMQHGTVSLLMVRGFQKKSKRLRATARRAGRVLRTPAL